MTPCSQFSVELESQTEVNYLVNLNIYIFYFRKMGLFGVKIAHLNIRVISTLSIPDGSGFKDEAYSLRTKRFDGKKIIEKIRYILLYYSNN